MMPVKRAVNRSTKKSSAEALAVARENIAKRGFLQEKEFPCHMHFSFYHIATGTYKLNNLIGKKSAGNLQVVREFYAQACTRRSWAFSVRNVQIDFTYSVFKKYLSLPTVKECRYKHYQEHEEEIPEDEIAKFLDYESQVSWRSPYGKQKYLYRQRLSVEARIWMHFIKDYIWPSSNRSRITRDQALLIYLLMRKEPVDLGRLIYASLKKLAADHTCDLVLPHLIATFCKEREVAYLDSDVLFQPTPPFNYRGIKLPSGNQRQPPQEQPLENVVMEDHQVPRENVEPTPHPTPSLQDIYALLQKTNEDMNSKFAQCIAMLNRQAERISRIETRLASHSSEEVSFDGSAAGTDIGFDTPTDADNLMD